MQPDDPPILRALKSFPPGGVYRLAPRSVVGAGYALFLVGAVQSYGWEQAEDGECLVAWLLRNNNAFQVCFTATDQQLGFICSCDEKGGRTACEHVCAALFLAIHLLTGAFRTNRYTDDDRHALLAGLQDPSRKTPSVPRPIPPPAPVWEILIRPAGRASTFSVLRDGKAITYDRVSPPPELDDLLYRYNAQEHFPAYLRQHGNKYPIRVQVGRDTTPVIWDPDGVYTTKTGINLRGDRVRVSALCFEGGVQRSPVHACLGLVADLSSGRLCPLEDASGWEVYRVLVREYDALQKIEGETAISDDPEDGDDQKKGEAGGLADVEMPRSLFQRLPLHLPMPKKGVQRGENLVLKIEGQEVAPVAGQVAYRLTLDPSGQKGPRGTVALYAECHVDGVCGAPTTPPFGMMFFMDEGCNVLPLPLQAQKRKRALFEMLLKLLPLKTKREVQELVPILLYQSGEFTGPLKSQAKSFLMGFWQKAETPSSRLTLGHGHFLITPNDIQRELLLYRIPLSIFGADIFASSQILRHDWMAIPPGALHKELARMQAECAKAGIALYYRGKPVVASRWNFAVDAQRTTGIDWFEIKPEIRCDGALLDEVALRSLFAAEAGEGMMEGEEAIQVLDNTAQAILTSLATVYATRAAQGREKEIVQVPRLHILDWVALRQQGVAVRISDEDEALIERLTHFRKIGESPLPKRLQVTMRPYQQEAYHWLAFLYENRLGACLADDMGLGKTLQAISLLAGLREGCLQSPGGPYDSHDPQPAYRSQPAYRPHLVVLPPSLLFNWENEIRRFYPDLKTYAYMGTARQTDFGGCDVVLTTYALVRRDIEKLGKIPFHVILFDEAQAVKNIHANTTGAVRQLKGHFKIVITGTPLENHLGEYYAIIDLALPGLLGEYDLFKSQINLEKSSSLDLLIRRARPFVLRRTKEKILKELPPKTESDVYLELTPKQKAFYHLTVARIRADIDMAYASKTAMQAQIIALTAILKLRQICVSPRLLDPKMEEPSPKITFLISQLQELREEGHSALVFSQFTSFLDLVEEALLAEKIPFLRLDGATAVGKRKKLVEGFQASRQAEVFLLSLKAGGQGLNLTKASYVYHLDPWWNPAVENQASDRAHRMGQENKVSITRILMRHTIEEKMMTLKARKQELYRAVMEETTGKKLSITRADFNFLLTG
jgi:non-specific serine/threonine protein kinase